MLTCDGDQGCISYSPSTSSNSPSSSVVNKVRNDLSSIQLQLLNTQLLKIENTTCNGVRPTVQSPNPQTSKPTHHRNINNRISLHPATSQMVIVAVACFPQVEEKHAHFQMGSGEPDAKHVDLHMVKAQLDLPCAEGSGSGSW